VRHDSPRWVEVTRSQFPHEAEGLAIVRELGLVRRRQREAGSWVIDEEPLADGDGWQDWPAFHRVATTDRARIRFYVTPPGAAAAEQVRLRRVAEHEYRIMSRLAHEGLLRPGDMVEDELGTGLVYPYDERRRQAIWAVVPQLINNHGPLVDRLAPALLCLVLVSGPVQRGSQVVESAGQLPPVVKGTVGAGGLAVELRRLVGTVELLVRLTSQIGGGGPAAAITQPPLEDRGPLAAGQRRTWITYCQLDPRQLRQPVSLPHVVVGRVGDSQ
jgi:hypothetical protein